MRTWLVLLTVCWLSACKSTPQQHVPVDASLWQDAHFQAVAQPIESAEQIFYLPPEVIAAAKAAVYPQRLPRERSIALLKFIFRGANNPLSYVNSATLTAEQTFQKGEANCLSLTILSYSLADQLGFKTQFRDVLIPEYWITRRGSSFLNGHVNLQVTPPFAAQGDKVLLTGEQNFVIDFELNDDRDNFAVRPLTEQQIVALFYNNKAADALWSQQYDLAYQYLKSAAKLAPELAVTWNNLAILYKNKSLLQPAEQAYLYALKLQPEQSNTMANLAMLYDMTGRQSESAALLGKVTKLREKNPYYFLMQGNEALFAGHFEQARQAYRRSLQLDSRNAEAYQGLAQIAFVQRQYPEAIAHLEKALRYANNQDDQQRFHGKIAWLNHALAKPH